MAKKETASPAIPVFPMLKTVEQMSKVSGIGENKLRELMDSGELEYIQNGNRRLIADAAIWDWYHRANRPGREKEVLCEKGLCHQKGSDAARSGNENEAPKSGANCVNHFTAETDRRKLP